MVEVHEHLAKSFKMIGRVTCIGWCRYRLQVDLKVSDGQGKIWVMRFKEIYHKKGHSIEKLR